MNSSRRILTLTLVSILASQQLYGKLSFEKIRSWFGNKGHETIIDKKFDAEKISTFILENIDGNITVKNSSKENKIVLKATKMCKKEEDAQKVRISKQDKDNTLILRTVYQETVKGAAIDYELVIPIGMKLQLSTINGSIYLNDTKSPIIATTEHGNIEANNVEKAIKATTKSNGSIVIGNVQGNVYADTNFGSINIKDAAQNVIAKTNKGIITVACSELPATSTIQLETKNGTINLALPASANATIDGSTRRGSLTSDHYLTIKSHTTKLNRQAWTRFKKEVHGILGSGEADIKLSADSGNIKILQTKTA